MASIEKSSEAVSMMKKAIYIACQGRLEKVLKRLLELEK